MQAYYTYEGFTKSNSSNQSDRQTYIRDRKKLQARQSKRVVRIAILVLLLAFSFTSGAYINVFANGNDKVEALPHSMTIDIQAGDTLWNIANAYAPAGSNVRSFMNEIIMINKLDSTVIYEGQLLEIPIK